MINLSFCALGDRYTAFKKQKQTTMTNINAGATKETFIANHNKEIQKLLKEISKKSATFAKVHYGKWHGDLGSVLSELQEINDFLK